MKSFKVVEWKNNSCVMIDQRLLPTREKYNTYRTHKEVARAIKDMVVRGAPAIGVAAAMGAALGAIKIRTQDRKKFNAEFSLACRHLAKARPTAVNLFWAIERMKEVVKANPNMAVSAIKKRLVNEAKRIRKEDIEINKRMGKNGVNLLRKKKYTILTHCNAGALATAGYGTALGMIRALVEAGKDIHVFADETRPFLQGSRLTAWELNKDNIDVTLITDNMAGHMMQKGHIDAVIVGSDRIASNGDVANKIGTYSVALLARAHKIPFFVVAPTSTIDMNIKDGTEIPIEERPISEVAFAGDRRVAPKGINIMNPAFDVTPARLVDAIVTERGVAKAPFRKSIQRFFS